MSTIPDEPHGNHAQLAELRQRYPEWVIEYGASGLPILTAELRSEDGRSIHFLAGHTLDELAARLETATTVQP